MVFGESFEEQPLSFNATAARARCDCCYAHGCACCYAAPPSDVGFIGCAPRLPAAAPLPDVSLMWAPVEPPGSTAEFHLSSGGGGAMHGQQYQSVTLASGRGPVGVANYGLNCQHGLALQAGRLYEGRVPANCSRRLPPELPELPPSCLRAASELPPSCLVVFLAHAHLLQSLLPAPSPPPPFPSRSPARPPAARASPRPAAAVSITHAIILAQMHQVFSFSDTPIRSAPARQSSSVAAALDHAGPELLASPRSWGPPAAVSAA